MADRIAEFSEKAGKRIAKQIRRLERHGLQHRYRRRNYMPSSSGSCITVHEIAIGGIATSGTMVLNVPVDDGTSVTTETVTLNYDDTATEVQTAFETHSEIASGDIDVKGGPLPNTAVYVVYLSTGTLNRHQEPPSLNTNSLGGTNPIPKFAQMTSVDWEA